MLPCKVSAALQHIAENPEVKITDIHIYMRGSLIRA
jgi:hypothetical protein